MEGKKTFDTIEVKNLLQTWYESLKQEITCVCFTNESASNVRVITRIFLAYWVNLQWFEVAILLVQTENLFFDKE